MSRKWENAYLNTKNPKASGALEWAPDPRPQWGSLRSCDFASLRRQISWFRTWASPIKSWIRTCTASLLAHFGQKSLQCQLPNRNVFCYYHQRKVRNTPAHWSEDSMLGWDRPHCFLTHHEHQWLITQICRNSNVKQSFSGIWTSADCNSRNVPICLKLFQQW